MQLFELEHMGRRRLATLKELLKTSHPEIDRNSIAARHGIHGDWNRAADDQNSMWAFLHALRELKSGPIPDIALRIGDRAQLTDAGLLGYAVLTSPTIMHASKLTSHALNSSHYLVRTRLSLNEELGRVVFSVVNEAKEFRQELFEMSLLAVWRCTQVILPSGRGAIPSYVSFNYPEPPHADQYRALFGCPVIFDQAHTVLAWPLAWMHAPIPTGSAELMRQCTSELEQVLGEGYRGNSIVARVKRSLVEHPQTCLFSLDSTAQLLKIHPRSLRRYLSESNTNFRQVCLEVRMELAQQYLRGTNMPLKAIAYQLGYRYANNFNRAYSDYYGEAPKQLRQRHQAAASAR